MIYKILLTPRDEGTDFIVIRMINAKLVEGKYVGKHIVQGGVQGRAQVTLSVCRQRRTMRRAEERAAKAKAELAAQQNQSESGQQAESSQQQREWDLLAEIAEKTADEEEGSESEAPVESHPLGEEPEDHQAA